MTTTIDAPTVTEICRRSAAGEGVQHILHDMGIDVQEGLVFLRDNYPKQIQDAKAQQIANKR